ARCNRLSKSVSLVQAHILVSRPDRLRQCSSQDGGIWLTRQRKMSQICDHDHGAARQNSLHFYRGVIRLGRMAEEEDIMHHPCGMRREKGAALVLSLLMLVILLVVGSGALTTSRIETQMASSDTKGKQVLLGAEFALAVGESAV